jgi:hypothetical protein
MEEERDKCLEPIRGSRKCQNFVVEGGTTCANHAVAKVEKKKKKAAPHASATETLAAAALIAKMEAMVPHLTPVRSNVLFNREAGNTFDRLVSSTQKTWQQRKRHVHQPQLESLVVQLQQQQILYPSTEGAPAADTVLLELGAGKGLLGRVLGEIHSVPFIAVDRRACDNANYDYDSGDDFDSGDALREGQEGRSELAVEREGQEKGQEQEGKEYSMRFHLDLADCNLSDVLATVGKRHARYLASRKKTRRVAPIATGRQETQVVALAKHLCANATDIALRCVATAADPIECVDGSNSNTSGANSDVTSGANSDVTMVLSSVVFAPCCHPQITMAGYCNPSWMETHHFDAEDLRVLGKLMAVTKTLGRNKMAANIQDKQASKQGWQVAWMRAAGGNARLWELGRLARRIIEEGRVQVRKGAQCTLL